MKAIDAMTAEERDVFVDLLAELALDAALVSLGRPDLCLNRRRETDTAPIEAQPDPPQTETGR